MAVYNTLEELLGTTAGMAILRNNTAQDDGTDTVAGVDWFTYNGVVAANLYASGNSWIGIGASAEHLRICRRDGKMYYLYRQDGTIGLTRFLKLRWEGYAQYNDTSAACAIRYELFLFDTGDMYLNLISVPTSYSGAYELVCGANTYPIPVTAGAPCEYSFYAQNTAGGAWRLAPERYPVKTKRYPSGSAIYTIPVGVIANAAASSIAWTQEAPVGTTITVKSAVSTSAPIDSDFLVCTSGAEIPGVKAGDSLTGKSLFVKVEMATTDLFSTPKLRGLNVTVKDRGDLNNVILTIDPFARFHNVVGPLTVSYDATRGNLRGQGGPVETFSRAFTPVGLIRKPNPNGPEHLEIAGASASGTLTRIYYSHTKLDERIELSAVSAVGKLTHIKDI